MDIFENLNSKWKTVEITKMRRRKQYTEAGKDARGLDMSDGRK